MLPIRLSLTFRASTLAKRRGPELWITRPHIRQDKFSPCFYKGSFEWMSGLAQEQTSASAALMSQNDPKRSLCSLLSTGATGRWRGLREESRRAIFYSCYRRDSLARSLQYPQSMPIYVLLARRP